MKNKELYLYERKQNNSGDFVVWMAFPGIYSFSLSSLGYLWMFKTIDEIDGVQIERICSDTKSPKFRVKDVRLFGFSFSFDTDFLTIFSMLEKYKIPLKSCDRTNDEPLIFAGGPVVTANPEPYKEFFDFFVIGDGEEVNAIAVEICRTSKDRKEALKRLSEIEGIYVPGLSQKVKKLTKKLTECIYTPIISEDAFFKNTFIIEMARGCANRCGFCLASYLNLPLRCVPYEKLLKTI